MADGASLRDAAAGEQRLAARPGRASRRRCREQANVMWLNYPNNPTGAVADLAFFARVVPSPGATNDHLPRQSLLRDRLRRLPGAQHLAGARRARCGGRVQFAEQDLQHGRARGSAWSSATRRWSRRWRAIKSNIDFGRADHRAADGHRRADRRPEPGSWSATRSTSAAAICLCAALHAAGIAAPAAPGQPLYLGPGAGGADRRRRSPTACSTRRPSWSRRAPASALAARATSACR